TRREDSICGGVAGRTRRAIFLGAYRRDLTGRPEDGGMTLKVIGAGLGRTGTLSLKLALEHIGFGPCYHMSEMLAQMRSHLPLWIETARGNPDWDAIF